MNNVSRPQSSGSESVMAFLKEVKGFDPAKLADEIIAAGHEYAELDSMASNLEELKKSMLAQFQLEALAESMAPAKPGLPAGKPITNAMAELKALADSRYTAHIEMMVDARKEANRARARYDALKIKMELMRTMMATVRQEMQLSGRF